MKLTKYLMSFVLASAGVATFTSCDDMLDKGNTYVIYADMDHLTSSSDTVTSVVGILNKLQAIAVRNNLLGEVRADLVKVNDNAIVDLKNLADFNADVNSDDESNVYNNPRDYYAVINNCNYFLDRVRDSLPEIHTPGMKYMFERETAAVHCIRAWTYLQCVLAYGKIPFVDKPVLTLAESKADHPMYELEDICDYFIKDLEPYKNVPLPDYNSFDNGNVTPKMCFFPANILLGDLYLWKAAKNHDAEAAKKAAKSYYDFIEWDLSGKKRTTTGTSRAYWSERDLYDNENLRSPNGSFSFGTSGTWGGANTECITAIAMDSSSAMGYYNELRNIYNTTNEVTLKEAQVNPSEQLKELSAAQNYVGYDTFMDTVEIKTTSLDDEAVERFYLGDLRFATIYSTSDYEYNDKLIKQQSISKHRSMNVSVYRVQQVYLRLAEALNYAGYPRFAKQILTTGLSEDVIKCFVQPYYTSPEDSAFISYFEFNNSFYKPYYETARIDTDKVYRIPTGVATSLRRDIGEANMWGIHSRGAGISFINKSYLPELPVDSTYSVYPTSQFEAIGTAPLLTDYTSQFIDKPKTLKAIDEPSTWAQYGDKTVDEATYTANYKSLHPNEKDSRIATYYERYISKDSIGLYSKYLVDYAEYLAKMEEYSADTAMHMNEYRTVLAAYKARVNVFYDAWMVWHNDIYSNPAYIAKEQEQVDQAILDEQALELCYEGNRFYDLMRRAYWYGDNNRLAAPIAKRNSALYTKLLSPNNWFLHYKGQIGK